SIIPLCSYLQSMMGDCTGISYIDSTKIAVCHNKRIYRHKVFKGLATRGKSSMGWFYGFKLHAIINHKGELVSVKVTAGNTDDRVPVKDMATPVFGGGVLKSMLASDIAIIDIEEYQIKHLKVVIK